MLQRLIHRILHAYATQPARLTACGFCPCPVLAAKAALPLKKGNRSPGRRIAACSKGRGAEKNSQKNTRKSKSASH